MKEKLQKLQALTGKTKIYLNWLAHQYVSSGLCQDVAGALDYMLEIGA